MSTLRKQHGFTLIEAVIYIALLSFILGGALLSAYQIFDGSSQIQGIALREAELNFVLRKLEWALSGSTIMSPGPGSVSSQLKVSKNGHTYTFSVDGTDTMSLDGKPLTNNSLNITNLKFEHENASPDVINITMTVNGEDVGPITKYVRETI